MLLNPKWINSDYVVDIYCIGLARKNELMWRFEQEKLRIISATQQSKLQVPTVNLLSVRYLCSCQYFFLYVWCFFLLILKENKRRRFWEYCAYNPTNTQAKEKHWKGKLTSYTVIHCSLNHKLKPSAVTGFIDGSNVFLEKKRDWKAINKWNQVVNSDQLYLSYAFYHVEIIMLGWNFFIVLRMAKV